jgi:hypothetical protein
MIGNIDNSGKLNYIENKIFFKAVLLRLYFASVLYRAESASVWQGRIQPAG